MRDQWTHPRQQRWNDWGHGPIESMTDNVRLPIGLIGIAAVIVGAFGTWLLG